MRNYILLFVCVITLFLGMELSCGARAQSAAACSKNVYAPLPDSVLKEQARRLAEEKVREETKMKLYQRTAVPLPDTVLNLLYGEQFEQSFAVLQEFLQTLESDSDFFHLVFLEEEYYSRRRFVDSANFDFYTQKRQEFVDRLLEEFPQHVETYTLVLDENSTPEEQLRVYSRMIEVDSTYLPAYEMRGRYWLEHKQMDKFCEDFRCLPRQIANLQHEFWECK